MKRWMMLSAVLALTGCGGANGFRGDTGSVPMATGPISTACMQSDRKARTRTLCGCIQAVANDTMSGTQQRRAVRFYRDPQAAQDIRQSKRSGDERFWEAYSTYAQRAEQVCR
ncbi:hypothetical protein [Roseovarius sp.]|uniref:hypothetical protein n=1 Tax=Roseovarius sp. TaxID=1486281 RepID=UPI003A9732B8